MNREDKAAVIDQIAGEFGESEAIFALDYRGITVAQIADLRDKLRASNTKLRVAKNSLSERAADQAGITDIKSLLVGPTALALVKGDAAAAAKVLSDTSRALRGPLTFKGGFMSGGLLSPEQVEAIAKLPTREVLNAQLVGTIAAPLSGLARTLNALIAGVAIQLGQIRDQGLVGGSAPASETPAASQASEAAEVADAGEPTEVAEASDASAQTETEAPSDEAAAAPAEGDGAEAEPTEPESTEGTSDDAPSDN